MADAHVETSSEVNQDSLDGAQPTVSDVGSAEEFEKDREEDTPSASNGEAEEANTGDVPEEVQGEESREAEGAADEVAALPEAEEEATTQETENGHQNGHNGDKPEADSTEVDGSVGEKRKSVGGEEDLSIKKARLEGEESDVVPAAATNGQKEETAA